MNKKTHPININPSRFLLGSAFTLGVVSVCLSLSKIVLKDLYEENRSNSYKVVTKYKDDYIKPRFESDLSAVSQSDILNPNDFVSNTQAFSDEERNNIKKISDDEYLAYATYKYICDKYDIDIFNNIAKSELTHYNTIFNLIKNDPESQNKFNDMFIFAETQSLYDTLTAQADISVLEALKVGLKIEELDIKDLETIKNTTTNSELNNIYNNLQKGSRNHLRSLYKVLSRYGESYTPEHLTQDELNSIILSPMELNKI